LSGVGDDLAALRDSPKRLAYELDRLAEQHPLTLKDWVQEHPKNLMAYFGWAVEDFHQAALEDVLRTESFLWLAPRGSGKSTAECVFFPVWAAIANPDIYTKAGLPYLFPEAPHTIGPHNIRVALTSNSSDKAVALQWQCKAVLTSPKMNRLFGPLEGSRWRDVQSDTALRTEQYRECTFTSLGLGSKIAGGHYDINILDDWVTEDNARTEMMRQRLSDFFKFTVSPTLEPWGRTAAAGTRYHPNDWYSEIKAWEKAGIWRKIRRTPALVEVDGEMVSYWPAVYPVKKLLEIKEKIGAIAFSTQYQNETDVMLGEFFEHAWMENFKSFDSLPQIDKEKARTFITLDPAIKGGPRNDFSVFTVTSYVAPYFFVRRVVRGKWTQHELIQRAAYLNRIFRPHNFGVEVVQGQEWLVQEMRRLHYEIPTRDLCPKNFAGKDKVGRASHVRSFFENGRVFLEPPTPDNGIGRLIEEMMAFTGESDVPGMDDCVDSLIWGLLMATRPQARLVKLMNRRGL